MPGFDCQELFVGFGNATIKYLRSFGYDVTNDTLERHSQYFRDALVRANYNNARRGIAATQKYLDFFFGNLLFGERNILYSVGYRFGLKIGTAGRHSLTKIFRERRYFLAKIFLTLYARCITILYACAHSRRRRGARVQAGCPAAARLLSYRKRSSDAFRFRPCAERRNVFIDLSR